MGWIPKRMSEEALKLRARGEYNRKDYENAERSLRKLRNITTDKTWANDVLARLYMNTGRHENAIPLLKDNLEKSTNKDRELHFLIKCYRVTKQYEKGLELIAESEILANNDEVAWDEAWAFVEDFNDVEAIEKFLNKIEKYSNREIHFDLMRLRLSLLKKMIKRFLESR